MFRRMSVLSFLFLRDDERWAFGFLVIAFISVGHMDSQTGLIWLRMHLQLLASFLGP